MGTIGELKGISKDVFVSQVGFKKGSGSNKIVFFVGNDGLGSEGNLDEGIITKIGKLNDLNPCLFVDGLIDSSVFDNYDVENINVDITLKDCDKVSNVKFDKIKGLVKSWKVSDVIGNGAKISFNINGKACGIRFDNFVNFASDCQKLEGLFEGRRFVIRLLSLYLMVVPLLNLVLELD